MNIDLVLFDLDDVLVDYDHDIRCRTLGKRIGRDVDTVHAALFDSGFEKQADLGLVDADGVARALSQTLDTIVEVEDCVAARAASRRRQTREGAGMVGHHYCSPRALRAHLYQLDLLEHATDAP
jgi:phosphoglycolate phosphatase-like HAD superfamily hydrolase